MISEMVNTTWVSIWDFFTISSRKIKEKTQTSSLKDFEKETILNLLQNMFIYIIGNFIYSEKINKHRYWSENDHNSTSGLRTGLLRYRCTALNQYTTETPPFLSSLKSGKLQYDLTEPEYIYKQMHAHMYTLGSSMIFLNSHTHIYTPKDVYCPVGWGCKIHRLHLCRGVRLPQQVSMI